MDVMIKMYCKSHHTIDNNDICKSCGDIRNYAFLRIDNCKFGADKPTCAKCPVHCYKKDRRAEIKEIMRYSGPRMLFRYPLLIFQHMMKNKKSFPY